VEALDYVRWPTALAARTADERGLPARFRTLNVYDARRVLALGAELAAPREPVVVFAHGLLGTLWDSGRPTLFRLLSMILRSGGEAHLDVPRHSAEPEPGNGVPLHRSIPVDALAAELAPFGLRIDEIVDADDVAANTPWSAGETRFPTTRMVVSWQRPAR
jgi:hypothetical protein